MNNRRSLRGYFPEPGFQGRYVAVLLLASAVQITVVALVLVYFLRQNYQVLVQYGGLDADTTRLLTNEFRWLAIVIAVSFALHMAGTLALGVLFSHRVGGAVYALKRVMQEITEGKERRLVLRKGDEFPEVADLFNAMVDRLKKGRGTR